MNKTINNAVFGILFFAVLLRGIYDHFAETTLNWVPALQAWLDRAASRGSALHLQDATYRIADTIHVKSGAYLVATNCSFIRDAAVGREGEDA